MFVWTSLSQHFSIWAENTTMIGSALGRQSLEHVRRVWAHLQLANAHWYPIRMSRVPVAPNPWLSSIHKIARSFPFAGRWPQEVILWHGHRKSLSCSRLEVVIKDLTLMVFFSFLQASETVPAPYCSGIPSTFHVAYRRGTFVPHRPGLWSACFHWLQ